MKGFTAPDVKITAAAPAATPVPLCKVDGVIGKEINFSIWLPDTWNGKFVMGGQGGYAGRVESQAMGMGALQKGYAVAGTDTGHVGPGGATDGSWALGNLERIVNYAHAADPPRDRDIEGRGAGALWPRAGEVLFRRLLEWRTRGADVGAALSGRFRRHHRRRAGAGHPRHHRDVHDHRRGRCIPIRRRSTRRCCRWPTSRRCRRPCSPSATPPTASTDGVHDRSDHVHVRSEDDRVQGRQQDGCLSKEEIAAVEAIVKGPMLNGKPYHVGFPWGGEGNRRRLGLVAGGMSNVGGPDGRASPTASPSTSCATS